MGRAKKKKVKWIEKCRKTYYTPKEPGSYSGIHTLQRVTGYKPDKIKTWISTQDTYTLHKPVRRKFQRRKVIVPGVNYQWAADLVDMASLKDENDNITFLLTVIDVFSKKAACQPLLRKTGACVKKAMKTILDAANIAPRKLQTDKGSEFYNKEVQALLKEHGIKMFSTENDEIKSSVIERFNRTLKSRMYKYFTAENTQRYLDVLPDLVDSYNNTYHTSIKMSPNQVNKDNEHAVRKNLYGKSPYALHQVHNQQPKLKIGDSVRISKTSRVFKKGYLPNWSEEIFTISSVRLTKPITYHIQEENGDEIKGSFYENELQKTQRDRVFQIEYELDKRLFKGKPQTLVKWKGYPDSYNQWIYDSSMQKVQKEASSVRGRKGKK